MSHVVMTEYEAEPIPGLPGIPPPGERILWQGSPDWRTLARTALHTNQVAAYFGLLVAWALGAAFLGGIASPADLIGVAATLAAGCFSVALLNLIAWASARTTIYTLTNRRIVLRIGIALPKCINLPLAMVGSVDLALGARETGDLALVITGRQKIGYVALWPHARPWRLSRPEPMLRALPEAKTIADLIARTCLDANRNAGTAPIAHRAPGQLTLAAAAA